MSDVANYVNYEFLYELDLKHPSTDEPTGIVFQIRSASSEEAKKVLRRHTDKNIERRLKGKPLKSETLEHQELEKAASYIASWDWKDNTFEGTVPELTMKTAVHVLSKASWIFQQVVEAATEVTNFSPRSETTSVDT